MQPRQRPNLFTSTVSGDQIRGYRNTGKWPHDNRRRAFWSMYGMCFAHQQNLEAEVCQKNQCGVLILCAFSIKVNVTVNIAPYQSAITG